MHPSSVFNIFKFNNIIFYVSFTYMNTFHLKYFIDSVRLGGVAAAADHNHITHSAVSQAIRSLERDLNTELLIHEKKKYQVTEKGLELFAKGQIWLQNLQEIKSEIGNSLEKVSGVLTIAAPQSIVREILWKKIISYRKSNPEVKVRVILGSAEFVSEQVRKGTAEIGFLLDQTDHSDLRTATLEQGKYILVSKHSASKAGQWPLIVTGQNRPEVQAIMRGLKRTTQTSPEVVFEIQSWSLIQKLVKDMDVFGIVPEFMVRNDLQKGKLYPVKTAFVSPEYDILALWTRYSETYNKVRVFLKELAFSS